MAGIWLPPKLRIAKAARGWPSSPKTRPIGAIKSSIGELQAFVELLPSGYAVDRINGGRVPFSGTPIQAPGGYLAPWYSDQTADVVVENLPVSVRDANLLVMEFYTANRAIDGSEFAGYFCQLNGGSSSAQFASISTSQAVNELFEIFNSTDTTTTGGCYCKYTDGYTAPIDTMTVLVAAYVENTWQIYIGGVEATMYNNTAGGADGTLFNGTALTRVGSANFSHDPQTGCSTLQFYKIQGLNRALARQVAVAPFILTEPANDTPYLIGISGGAAPAYDEHIAASTATDLALSDAWALNYPEAFAASTATALALSDAWALDYAEAFSASTATALALSDTWALDYAEAFSASTATALALSDTWALDYAEAFAASTATDLALTHAYQLGADYVESFAASTATELALSDAWALNYPEAFAASTATDLALSDAWALNYPEAFAASTATDLALAEAWALDYAESFAASTATDLALTEAYAIGNHYAERFAANTVTVATFNESWTVYYSETFAASTAAELALGEAWALDYLERFAASTATELALTEAYETPAPGVFDETFSVEVLTALAMTHAFTTPNVLPAGIRAVTAEKIAGAAAHKIGGFYATTL